MSLDAPFPYFGGKSNVADIVWQRFGDVKNYAPCFTNVRGGNPNSLSTEAFVRPEIRYKRIASSRCLSVQQGGRPVRFVSLRVDHLRCLRAKTKFAKAFCLNSGIWIARCSALVTNSKFSKRSLSVLLSLWWIPIVFEIDPFADSQICLARRTQTLGSAIFIKARCSLCLFFLVLITIEPIGYLWFWPCPNLSFMGLIIS